MRMVLDRVGRSLLRHACSIHAIDILQRSMLD
jgi:hypothetical protein